MMLKTKFSSKVDLTRFGNELFNCAVLFFVPYKVALCKTLQSKHTSKTPLDIKKMHKHMEKPHRQNAKKLYGNDLQGLFQFFISF